LKLVHDKEFSNKSDFFTNFFCGIHTFSYKTDDLAQRYYSSRTWRLNYPNKKGKLSPGFLEFWFSF